MSNHDAYYLVMEAMGFLTMTTALVMGALEKTTWTLMFSGLVWAVIATYELGMFK